MKPLCIYHGNCADGFTAAWAVWKRFGEEFDYHPGVYGQPPPDVTGRRVYIVDFSYKYEVLVEMSYKARSLFVLDHHKTAAEDLARLPALLPHPAGFEGSEEEVKHVCWSQNMPEVGALFDMDKSGAGIAWDYFHAGKPRPALVNYVEDRDLWRFKLEDSREHNANIFSYEYTFENWDSLAEQLDRTSGLALSLEGGAAIERKHHKDVGELVKALKQYMTIGGFRVPVANLPYTLTSDAGHLMCTQPMDGVGDADWCAEKPPFAACYWDTPKGRVFSLRSIDGGTDVSAIAASYGGGGHKNASGFTLPHGVSP